MSKKEIDMNEIDDLINWCDKEQQSRNEDHQIHLLMTVQSDKKNRR